MADIIEPEVGDGNTDFKREAHRLFMLYYQLIEILESFLGGGILIVPTDELNRYYLLLCYTIEEILKKPGFENLIQLEWRPLDNLRAADGESGDYWREYGGRRLCNNFLSAIEELLVRMGKKDYPTNIYDLIELAADKAPARFNELRLRWEATEGEMSEADKTFDNLISRSDSEIQNENDMNDIRRLLLDVLLDLGDNPLDRDDLELLCDINGYLQSYVSYKKEEEARFLERETKRFERLGWQSNERKEEQAKEQKEQEVKSQNDLLQFDFGFVADEEIRDLLINDLREAQKAFENSLYKATVVLYGAIIEALLIETLSRIQADAKMSFAQLSEKYNWRGWKKKREKETSQPPEIEDWYMYELIAVAEKEKIISRMVAWDSYLVKNYRNFIHLYAQKRDRASISEDDVSTIIGFVKSLYSNISEWYQKQQP